MSRMPSREEVLFADALAQPEALRAEFLDAACRDDGALRDRIIALLAAHDGIRTLDAPVIPQFSILCNEKPGDLIGRYKLLMKIGEGGCGVVFLAEQKDPVRRRVALKVIKAGMDTREVIARFEAERQALAMMDHPGICKVLDAGATETGRPYFVMEYVRGVPITKYCDEYRLSTDARLRLFMQVCHAVQHAHQKGIIHRDLKPSNILVGVEGTDAAPKVIDFGIAKATQGRLTDATLVTAFEQFMGTPAYMSPEQAEMTSLDIDTRSDVYSLGVLLYELLTGRQPFDPKTLMAASRDEMRRIIREVDPVKPSTRLSALPPPDQAVVAERRATDPSKLRARIRGDLDWIVMRALEKNRVRRYETPATLANDIVRHLQHESIIAGAPGRLYRVAKFTQRHRFGVSAAVAVTFVLVAGIIASTLLAVRATRAEKRSDELLNFMFGEFLSEVQKTGRLDVVEKVIAQMTRFAVLEPGALNDGAILRKVKSLRQSGDVEIKKARYAEAAESLAAAYVRAGELVARNPRNGEMLFERAQIEFHLGEVHRRQNDLPAAIEWITRYRDSAAALVNLEPANSVWQQEIVSAHHNLAVLELEAGNVEGARSGFLAKLALNEKMAASRPNDAALQTSLANTISFLGTVAERSGDFAEALARYREQTSRLEALRAREPKDMALRYNTALSLSLQVDVLAVMGRRAEAREVLAQARAMFEVLVSHDPANQRWLSNALAARVKEVVLNRAEGDLTLAGKRLGEILPLIEKVAVALPSDRNVAGLFVTAWRLESALRQAAGRADAAEAADRGVQRAAQLVKAGLADSKNLGECAQVYVTAGSIAASAGQREPAEGHWRHVLEMVKRSPQDSNDWRLMDPAARALAFLGRRDESRAMITRLHALGYRPLQPWPEAVAP